ncbi:helix-turn-helix domain-containing protein [Streptomyces sp. NPDC005811]|uniref:winged helix-turn-helix transcriptional regulator n=1 Tax=Streptomyces sp. NPDC005811 TaxID=3154565 RepID=UPI0033FE0530
MTTFETSVHSTPGPTGDVIPPTEYCPVSVGTRVIGDRWTLLIIREVMVGATRFTEIHRGLPGLSRTLLSTRLRHLERLGLLDRVPTDRGGRFEYHLTVAGHAVRPVIEAIGRWSADWCFPPPTDEQSDAALLLWRLYQSLDHEALPNGRIGIEFRFPEGEHPRGWLHAGPSGSGVCVGATEYDDVDLIVVAAPRVLSELRMGVRSCEAALTAGDIEFQGPPHLVQGFRTRWFRPSPFAAQLSARQM